MNNKLIEMACASMPAKDGWEQIGAAKHPANGERGMLLRNTRTGIYTMDTLGALRSVPQEWARALHARDT